MKDHSGGIGAGVFIAAGGIPAMVVAILQGAPWMFVALTGLLFLGGGIWLGRIGYKTNVKVENQIKRHTKQQLAEATRPGALPSPKQNTVPVPVDRQKKLIEEFEAAGLPEDASLLRKLKSDRDAIVELLGTADEFVGRHEMQEVVHATWKAALRRSADILDYERRMNDPLLDVPEGSRLETSRQDVQAAYVALADTRTRIRGELAADADGAISRFDYAPLCKLVERLEDEGEIAERVDARMSEIDRLDVRL